jgi:uncharacterized repeat protein (TIGR01451 family)
VQDALVTATAEASPTAGGPRSGRGPRSIRPERPAQAAFEVIGIPALQLSIKDANDPVAVGQRTTYTVRVRNAGTLAARQVAVTAVVPNLLKATRATGPKTAGTITADKESARVTFPALDSLAPNAEATFVIEVDGAVPGDARFRAEARSLLLAHPLRAEEPTRVLARPTNP